MIPPVQCPEGYRFEVLSTFTPTITVTSTPGDDDTYGHSESLTDSPLLFSNWVAPQLPIPASFAAVRRPPTPPFAYGASTLNALSAHTLAVLQHTVEVTHQFPLLAHGAFAVFTESFDATVALAQAPEPRDGVRLGQVALQAAQAAHTLGLCFPTNAAIDAALGPLILNEMTQHSLSLFCTPQEILGAVACLHWAKQILPLTVLPLSVLVSYQSQTLRGTCNYMVGALLASAQSGRGEAFELRLAAACAYAQSQHTALPAQQYLQRVYHASWLIEQLRCMGLAWSWLNELQDKMPAMMTTCSMLHRLRLETSQATYCAMNGPIERCIRLMQHANGRYWSSSGLSIDSEVMQLMQREGHSHTPQDFATVPIFGAYPKAVSSLYIRYLHELDNAFVALWDALLPQFVMMPANPACVTEETQNFAFWHTDARQMRDALLFNVGHAPRTLPWPAEGWDDIA